VCGAGGTTARAGGGMRASNRMLRPCNGSLDADRSERKDGDKQNFARGAFLKSCEQFVEFRFAVRYTYEQSRNAGVPVASFSA